ncbi:MAG: fibronectin-binding protein, partial [Streptococcus agalactiae]
PKTYVVVVQNSGKTTIVDEANFKEADYPMADNTSHVECVALLQRSKG